MLPKKGAGISRRNVLSPITWAADAAKGAQCQLRSVPSKRKMGSQTRPKEDEAKTASGRRGVADGCCDRKSVYNEYL